jgi:hypothetical protein
MAEPVTSLPQAPMSLTVAQEPISFGYPGQPQSDPVEVLADETANRKFVALRQRRDDLFAQTPSFADVSEQRQLTQQHQKRIADLTRAKSEGGFGLMPLAPQLVAERRKLERAEKESEVIGAEGSQGQPGEFRRNTGAQRFRLDFARRHPRQLRGREHRRCAVVGAAEEGRDHRRRC